MDQLGYLVPVNLVRNSVSYGRRDAQAHELPHSPRMDRARLLINVRLRCRDGGVTFHVNPSPAVHIRRSLTGLSLS